MHPISTHLLSPGVTWAKRAKQKHYNKVIIISSPIRKFNWQEGVSTKGATLFKRLRHNIRKGSTISMSQVKDASDLLGVKTRMGKESVKI